MDVRNYAFPSDNAWDVPLLRLDRQPVAVDLPLRCWGSVARSRMAGWGGWHFYTDDERFNALRQDPGALTATEPRQAVEPNFTVLDDAPAAHVLQAVWWKRWLARWWQEQHVEVFVDLNVPAHFQSINLLGVPRGWRAYATRGYERRVEDLDGELALAREHAGGEPLFVVVGGGRRTHAWCLKHAATHVGYRGTRRVHSAAAGESCNADGLPATGPQREGANADG